MHSDNAFHKTNTVFYCMTYCCATARNITQDTGVVRQSVSGIASMVNYSTKATMRKNHLHSSHISPLSVATLTA